MRVLLLLIWACSFGGCIVSAVEHTATRERLQHKINGIALVTTPNPYKENPLLPIKELGMDWVSIQPFAFFYKDSTIIQYGGYQWWGNSIDGVVETIALAKAAQLKTLLKPQLWAYNQWIGDLEFDTASQWDLFETNYRNFILPMATLADSLEVEMFSIGTEMKQFALQRPQFWRHLIKDIRKRYSGKIIYASNWDSYHAVSFWDALDYVGIDAYFPLIKKKKPSVKELKIAWQPTIDSLQEFYEVWEKPIVFTEFGYMSLQGTAYKAWLLEKVWQETKISEKAQAQALQALYEVFSEKTWWAGGFQWKWYADLKHALKADDAARDYTPQGKEAEKLLRELLKKSG